MQKKLFKLIDRLLKNNYKAIYRPHPSNFNDKPIVNFPVLNIIIILYLIIILNILIVIKNQSFNNWFIGTAYTYAITTGRPVIFFNHNDKYLKKFNYHELNYFIDRDKIGWKFKNVSKIINFLKKNNKYKNEKLLRLKKFKKIFYDVKKFDLNYLLKHD